MARESIRFKFLCRLPVDVKLGQVRWTIGLDWGNKGRYMELYAEGSNGLRGVFCRGRTRNVEGELSAGISVPVGTIRCRLVMALIENKQAVLI